MKRYFHTTGRSNPDDRRLPDNKLGHAIPYQITVTPKDFHSVREEAKYYLARQQELVKQKKR